MNSLTRQCKLLVRYSSLNMMDRPTRKKKVKRYRKHILQITQSDFYIEFIFFPEQFICVYFSHIEKDDFIFIAIILTPNICCLFFTIPISDDWCLLVCNKFTKLFHNFYYYYGHGHSIITYITLRLLYTFI